VGLAPLRARPGQHLRPPRQVAPAGETVAEGGDLRPAAPPPAPRPVTHHDGYRAHAPSKPTPRSRRSRTTAHDLGVDPDAVPAPLRGGPGARPARGGVRVVPPFVGGGFGGKTANRRRSRPRGWPGSPDGPAGGLDPGRGVFYDTFSRRRGDDRRGVTPPAASRTGTTWSTSRAIAARTSSTTCRTTGPWLRRRAGGRAGTHPFATGAWRAPGNNTNTFARESHIDILAAMAGLDPSSSGAQPERREDARRAAAAAERFSWRPAKAPSGRGQASPAALMRHLCCARRRGRGRPRLGRVASGGWSAPRNGPGHQPGRRRDQMEGCLTMGMGYALAEELRFSGGEVLDRNFDTYEIPRFSWLPAIETVIVDAPNDPPQVRRAGDHRGRRGNRQRRVRCGRGSGAADAAHAGAGQGGARRNLEGHSARMSPVGDGGRGRCLQCLLLGAKVEAIFQKGGGDATGDLFLDGGGHRLRARGRRRHRSRSFHLRRCGGVDVFNPPLNAVVFAFDITTSSTFWEPSTCRWHLRVTGLRWRRCVELQIDRGNPPMVTPSSRAT